MAGEKQTDEPIEGPGAGGRKKKLKPLIMVGVLMVAEGAGIFGMMKFFAGPPEPTLADEDDAEMKDPLHLGERTEIELCKVDSFNRKEGKLHVYHIELSALIATDDVDTLQRFVDERSASIRDRVQLVIRSADPRHLNDPALLMIKKQIKQELNNLIGGKELIQEVLVAKLLQSRTSL